jgi:Mn2+/Fe2+ NRAMP family transporter
MVAVAPRPPRLLAGRHRRRTWRQYFRVLGPGVISGAADNDPSGVITYTQIGASSGFSLLWLMLLSTAMLYAVEDLATRLALCTRRALSKVMRDEFDRRLTLLIVGVFAASNVATIGADLAGTAAAVGFLTGTPFQYWIVPLTAAFGALLIFAAYKQVSRFLLILTPFFLVYIITGFVVRPRWSEVLQQTFLPAIDLRHDYVVAALGLLGATLTPYMFFWQSNEEVEARNTTKDLPGGQVDIAIGMVYANLIFYFIILTAAATLFGRPDGDVKTVGDAAKVLHPLLGPFAGTLFGMIVSGILSIPVMAASSGYAVAECFGWREGLDRKWWQAREFYVVIAGALGIGAVVAVAGVSPVSLMFWTQVGNGMILPVVIIVLLVLGNRRRLMGAHRPHWIVNGIAGVTALIAIAFTAVTVRGFFGG